MRLEFEPNASALPFVENEVVNKSVSSEVEKLLREGVKAAQEGKRSDARNLLLRVTESDADNENAWLWLASISEYPEELLVFLNNVLRINPQNDRAIEWHKATKSLLAKTLVQRGVDALNDNRKDFARQCFEQAVEHEAENEMAWLWLASAADSDEEKAVYFEKVLSVNPDNETAQTSLKAFESQKTHKFFGEALTAAFDGRHADAQVSLESVLSRNSELEDAWVLKAHLANSFEERSEALLKVSALNPENEMARAVLASWRALSDKLGEFPKIEEAAEVFAAPELEAAKTETVVEESFTEEQAAEETLVEESANEDFTAEFSAYPSNQPEFEEETAQMLEETVFEDKSEDEVLEFNAPETSVEAPVDADEQPAYFTEEDLQVEEFSSQDAPTQELNPAELEPQTPVLFEEQTAENQTVEENQSEENQNAEVSFEAPENQECVQELSVPENDLSLEIKEEEDEMHWAFTEQAEAKEAEDFFQNADNPDDIHRTQSSESFKSLFSDSEAESLSDILDEELKAETVTEAPVENSFADLNEDSSEEWKNTLPDAFVNYEAPESETSFEAETSYTEETPAVEESVESPEFVAESVQIEEAAQTEEETAEFADVKAEEQAPVEAVEPQKQEEYAHPKAEAVLCPFCNAENEKQAFSCASCHTILTLSDLEMLLGQNSADQEKLQQAVTSLESENASYGLNAEQLASLGIGHINLKNHRQGFHYLQEAVRMNPNNVLLDAQVNALAIRLSELEEQQNAHDAMAKNRKILVVDDSPTVRKLIAGKLEKCGHEVICAVDGLDALQKINELQPDLILLDITMPRMDGYQVCKLIRSAEATKDVPVVMISGKDGFFDKVRGRMAGTTGYITKPFGPETLMKTVETYLN